MNTTLLKDLDFELAYLAALTCEGIKPLSRWEKGIDRRTEETLRRLGLQTRAVERSVLSGRRMRELLFSTSEQCLEVYAVRFAGKPVDRSPETMRAEGRLFGYPACCVESYATRGYARNSLRRRDQRILFHWACPQCAVTPLLLPPYRRIYQACRAMRCGRSWSLLPKGHSTISPHLRRAAAMAASLVAVGLFPTALLSATPGGDPLDPHVMAFAPADDPDRDFLASNEETILGMDPAVFDENGNAIPDGVDLAHQLSAAIDALPTTPSATRPYALHHMAFGLENCQVCGAVTNMGSLEVINPLEDQSFAMPYVAKHFLEHGGFSYVGTNFSGVLHSGRLNPALLRTVLTSAGLGHFISEPDGTDADSDGLRQWEESGLGTDPGTSDTDGDHLIDGIDLARSLRQTLDTLPKTTQTNRPHVIEHPMDGVETCPRCGESVVMGLWEVINPLTSDSITIPSMALHYLQHGGFGWKGGRLLGGDGRIDPRQLQAVLTGQPNQHLLGVTPDDDRDYLTNQEEGELGKHPTLPDEDHNAVLDGLDLARATVCAIAALPSQPRQNEVYRLDFLLRGLERCAICGTNVNMGHLMVCNPLAQLYATLPYIALHYLEHDSFSFAGDVHGKGRTEVRLLWDALRTTGPSHMLAVADDTDADRLKDGEEAHFGTLPNNPDTDGDGVGDGTALSRKMHERIKVLPTSPGHGSPHVIPHEANCFAPCPVCGEELNCGLVEITNAWVGLSLRVSYMNLHFLAQGSFAASASERVDPVQLETVLRTPVVVVAGESQVTVRWLTQAGHRYQLFTAPEAAGPWTPGPVFTGNGAELRFTEDRPAGSPRKFYQVAASAPTGPDP